MKLIRSDMRSMRLRLSSFGLLLCLVGVLGTPAEAQTAADSAASDSTESVEPYETDLSLVRHILAFPSTVFHHLTRPLGEAVIWAEEKGYLGRQEEFFWFEDRTIGVFPAFRIGGGLTRAVGATVVHGRLFGQNHEGELRFLYRNTDNFSSGASFSNPDMFGPASFFDVDLGYRADSDEKLFLDGGEAEESQASFRENRVDARAEVGLEPRRGPGWSGILAYHGVNVGAGQGAGRFPETLPGVGTTHLLSARGSVLFDLTEGPRPRETAGSRLFFRYSFSGSLNKALRYHRFRGEWQQFLPLPFPYPYRRLAFRTRVEKLVPTADMEIPFYELSTLGNASALRGFERNQFRDEGTLLFTLEYRYPIWDTWDALLFVDTGQAFENFSDITASDFRWAYGFGFRFNTSTGLGVRLDVGFSQQNMRFFSSGGPNFTVTTRGQE